MIINLIYSRFFSFYKFANREHRSTIGIKSSESPVLERRNLCSFDEHSTSTGEHSISLPKSQDLQKGIDRCLFMQNHFRHGVDIVLVMGDYWGVVNEQVDF